MRCSKCGRSVLKINLRDPEGCILCINEPTVRTLKKRGRKKKEDLIIYSIDNDRNENEPEFVPQCEPGELKPSEISCDIKHNSYTVVPRVFHNDFCYKVGDIVSLRENNVTYYAQIRILVKDIFNEKFAAVIWLLPTVSANDFNPFTFIYGPQDEWFYNLEDVSFVMHAPSEFFKRFIPPLLENSKILPVVRCKYKPSVKRKS